ncbi:prepilin-type N-terminal cleavage/methylation domain-containing protein [bacterium]|nr:prepilin-type N-terminal cleavage/methylation domain-containing protein [bacterium]
MQAQRPATRPARAAFTLIEILMVVAILAILAALILPAVNNARLTAQYAQVNADMQQIGAAITAFKVRFGVEPPSAIVICENPADWATEAVSRRRIKQIWPQFDFSKNRAGFDGKASTTTKVPLDGRECLVFFLGGMVDGGSGALRGFSKNPSDPFLLDNGTRDGPFLEINGGFDPSTGRPTGRLVDSDGDGAPELVDTLNSQTQPYLYFSSYGGAGYQVTDNGSSFSPYFRDAGRSDPYNSDGYQLISPGMDNAYGSGGPLDTEDANGNGTLDSGEDTNGNGQLDREVRNVLSGTRQAEADNLTNFHSGLLGDK